MQLALGGMLLKLALSTASHVLQIIDYRLLHSNLRLAQTVDDARRHLLRLSRLSRTI